MAGTGGRSRDRRAGHGRKNETALTLLALIDRLCTMLTRLAHMGDRPSGRAQIGHRERERER